MSKKKETTTSKTITRENSHRDVVAGSKKSTTKHETPFYDRVHAKVKELQALFNEGVETGEVGLRETGCLLTCSAPGPNGEQGTMALRIGDQFMLHMLASRSQYEVFESTRVRESNDEMNGILAGLFGTNKGTQQQASKN